MAKRDKTKTDEETEREQKAWYPSEVVLGQKYRDKRHGIEGHAVAITFMENSCTRVVLEFMHAGEIKQVHMDDVELEQIDGSPVEGTGAKPGGVKTMAVRS